MSSSPPPSPNDWTSREGTRAANSGTARIERRNRQDRRKRIWWSLVYGSFRPRRRRPARRIDEVRYQALDWHAAHLLAVSIGILILCVADAFLTLTLISGGAIEVNPVMAPLVGGNVEVFVRLKMAATGCGVMLLVFLARYRFLRVIRVELILYGVLGAYILLLAHEIRMLGHLADAHFF